MADEKKGVRLLDPRGEPLKPQKPLAIATSAYNAPYDAADIYNEHMESWRPYLWSPDGELNMFRDRMVSRMRDLVRNDGWASAAVTRTIDNVIGADFRPIPKPDYKALQAATGIKGFDHVWAAEFAKTVGALYRLWAYDVNRYCDRQRGQTFPQLQKLAFRHQLIDGDALAMLHWEERNVTSGKAPFATMVQIIDPDRLSNPQLQFDQRHMRGGVVVDDNGVAVGYYIRRAHAGDWFNADKSLRWDLIPRETSWGRPIIVHYFDHDRAAQNRGGTGILTPVIQRLKMLIKYEGSELDAAIINAIFGAYIESPYDPAMVEEAMGDGEEMELGAYQNHRTEFHAQNRVTLGGSRLPILFPGEKINAVTAARPGMNFQAFESAMLRNVAAGAGLTTQQISQNWAEVNYSSFRAASLEAWKTLGRRRTDFATGFSQPIFAALVEEMFDRNELPLPAGAPEFSKFRYAYARAHWQGPGKGYVDVVKERQGAMIGMQAGMTTLSQQTAELDGNDWEEVLEQRALEMQRMEQLGLPLPQWIDPASKDDASSVDAAPEGKTGSSDGSHDKSSTGYRS